MAQRDEPADRQAIHEVVLRYSGHVEWVARGLARLGGTMHMLANHLVDLRGDRAVAETYGQAVHWPTGVDDPIGSFTTGFRYVDDFAYRDGRWAIAERWAVREWTHRNTVATLPAATGPVPRRDTDDPLYLALARLDTAP